MTIHSETVIDEAVVKKLAEISVERENGKYPHRRLLLNLLAVVLLVLAGWYLWSWIDSGMSDDLNGNPLVGVMLVVMSGTVLFYANTDPMKNATVKLRKSLGTHWYYDFAEDGIHAAYDGEDGVFEWDTVTNWWEENDFFCLDVTGNPIVVPKKQFNMKQRKALRELLDANVRIRTDDEVKAERRAAKRNKRKNRES